MCLNQKSVMKTLVIGSDLGVKLKFVSHVITLVTCDTCHRVHHTDHRTFVNRKSVVELHCRVQPYYTNYYSRAWANLQGKSVSAAASSSSSSKPSLPPRRCSWLPAAAQPSTLPTLGEGGAKYAFPYPKSSSTFTPPLNVTISQQF